MTAGQPRARRRLAAILMLGIAGGTACAALSVTAAHAQQAATGETAAREADTASEVMEFPRTVILPGGSFTVYEPQIEDHDGFTNATAWSAAVFRPSEGEATVGAIKYSAKMVVDLDDRVVTIFDRELLELKFPELDDIQLASLTAELRAGISTQPETMPLDVVLGYVVDKPDDDISVEVSHEPPTILYATVPTLLVVIDGEPIKVAVDGAEGLAFTVNTNWDLFHSEATDRWSLLLGDTWLTAATLEGPWGLGAAPEGVSALPEDERWKAVREASPNGSIASTDVPDIRVAAAPAELIVTKGAAELEPVPGTQLSFVSNTSSDIVFNADDGYFYFLTSGRRFKAKLLNGPWSSVTSLPDDFLKIPAGHPRGHVRASIPGTPEAALAVAQAQVPQTADVSRTTEAPVVIYAGDNPEFARIERTNVYRATNTSFDVFRVDGMYYLCHNAVWFVAADPKGPWRVTDMIPADIYQIPADSPSHHVTYVKVYETTPESVYFGYTPGYHYAYVSNGVVVYGSGYYWGTYYNPYYYTYYPAYYYRAYPYTYGQASIYQVNTGTYVHGHYAYGPYGGVGESVRYNPTTGRYGGSAYAYDYDTAVYEGWSYNPRNGVSTSTSQSIQWSDDNSYEAWGETVVQRDDNWVQAERYRTEDGFTREVQTSEGGQAVQAGTNGNRATVGQTAEGELYAGANGNVYRRNEDGEWETRSDGEWTSVDTEAAGDSARTKANDAGFDTSSRDQTERVAGQQDLRSQSAELQQLERDTAARTGGRSRYDSFRSSSGGRSGGCSLGGRRR